MHKKVRKCTGWSTPAIPIKKTSSKKFEEVFLIYITIRNRDRIFGKVVT